MSKRKNPRGKTRIHREPRGTPISVHEGTDLSLYWHCASDMGQEDARGFDSLGYPVGWVGDEEDRWQLWFTGSPARGDALPPDYPLFWEYIEYTDSSSRKKPAALEAVSPVILNPSMPNWSPEEARLAMQVENETAQSSIKTRRAKHKLEAWDLGARTVKGIACPRFRANERRKECVTVELEPYSTARMLLRVIEQASMHLPKASVKDSELEPLLKLTEFLGAMDYKNFGLAASMCAGRYVKAFTIAVPEPYRSLILPGFCEFAAEELERIAPETHEAAMDIPTIKQFVAGGPNDGFISIEQIALDLDNDDQAVGATTPRRLAEKLDRLGVQIIAHQLLGDAILLRVYRKHRATLLRHGNEKPWQ